MEDIQNRTSELPILNPQSPSDTPIFQKNKFPKKIIILVSLSLLTIITIVLTGIVFSKKTAITKTNQTEIKTNTNEVDTKTNPGWKIYRNDVLGIEFQYPQKWGNLTILPVENITDLKTVNKDFLNLEENDLRYMVKISFSENPHITFSFINNQFPGYKYPNGFALKYGPMDNFKKLITNKNICDYHFNFKNNVDGRNVSFLESDNKCENNIKTTLFFENPGAVNQLGDKYFNYQIKQFVYKHLENNFFDNLLIESFITSYQGPESSLTFDQVIAKKSNGETFEVLNSDLKQLTDSIKIFSPPVPTPIVFKENPQEDKNMTTIRQYYYYLATQKLSDAYAMYQKKNISFNNFTQWYSQVTNTNVYNIQKTGTNLYTFNVDLSESNNPITKYKVVMEVNNNKINTLSSEQITNNQIKINNLTAFTRLKSGKNEIVLTKDGQEIILDSGDNDWENHIRTSASFSSLSFSPQGNYLFFVKGGWEIAIASIYDIKNQKMFTFPKDVETCSADVKFSSDEKYIFVSSEPGICSANQAKIINLSTGLLVHDFFKDINRDQSTGFEKFSLEYLKDQNIVDFKYSTNTDQILKTEKFNLNTGNVIQ
jgi:hypothetical protein